MGRTLKRVPMDFAWPLNKIWEGYINPIQPETCPNCHGTGNSPQVEYLYDKWYGRGWEDWVWCDKTHTRRWNRAAWRDNLDEEDVQALIDADRLWDFTRVPRTEEQRRIVEARMREGHNNWLPESNGYIPTPEEVNEWNKRGLGHDSINAHIVIKAKAEKRGYPLYCAMCNGDGHLFSSPEQKQEHEAWEKYEPPTGEGYQLWETTTEGSPQSPVFATLDELCDWCADNATTFGSSMASAYEWKRMLSDDFVYHQEGNAIFL